jgi:hypothetical protein
VRGSCPSTCSMRPVRRGVYGMCCISLSTYRPSQSFYLRRTLQVSACGTARGRPVCWSDRPLHSEGCPRLRIFTRGRSVELWSLQRTRLSQSRRFSRRKLPAWRGMTCRALGAFINWPEADPRRYGLRNRPIRVVLIHRAAFTARCCCSRFASASSTSCLALAFRGSGCLAHRLARARGGRAVHGTRLSLSRWFGHESAFAEPCRRSRARETAAFDTALSVR